MTITQQPQSYCFASMMKDFIIDSDASIGFVVKYKNKSILDESYCPDGNRRIIIRGLGKLVRLALWGVWYGGTETAQSDIYGVFDFYIDGTKVASSTVIYASMATRKDAASLFATGGFLSRVSKKVTRTEAAEWLTMVVPAGVAVTSTPYNGKTAGTPLTVRAASTTAAVVTLDVSYPTLFKTGEYDRYTVTCGESFQFIVDSGIADGYHYLRYTNMFDAPETLIFRGNVTTDSELSAETAEIDGETRRVRVTPKDSLTLESGPFYLGSDYNLFHDLANALKTYILSEGEWVGVIISKYSLKYNNHHTAEDVSFTVSPSNPENETIIL